MARRHDPVRPFAIVGDQHQAGGVGIQPARHVQTLGTRNIDEVDDGGVFTVAGGADHARRLVEHVIAWLRRLDQDEGRGRGTARLRLRLLDRLPVDFNPGIVGDMTSRIGHHFPVHAHIAGTDQPLRLGARAPGGMAKKTVEPHAANLADCQRKQAFKKSPVMPGVFSAGAGLVRLRPAQEQEDRSPSNPSCHRAGCRRSQTPVVA